MNTTSLKRGDLVIVEFAPGFGSVQGGKRPAIVLQNNTQNTYSPTTIVAPITSVLKKTNLSSHIVLGRRFGLMKESMVLMEQVRTVNQSDIIKVIGSVTDEQMMANINSSLLHTFGMPCNSSVKYKRRDG